MEWTMLCYDGTEYTLPTPVAWRLNYGLGTPCDSVWVKTLWSAGQESRLDMKRVAQAPFWVLRGAVMPSVLIETGFITELSEAKRLAQPAYQQRMAESIASGIINFINR